MNQRAIAEVRFRRAIGDARKPRRRARPRRMLPPRKQERLYSRLLLAEVAMWEAEVRRLLIPRLHEIAQRSPMVQTAVALDSREVRMDGFLSFLGSVFKHIATAIFDRSPTAKLTEAAKTVAYQTDEHARTQLRQQFVDTLGVDLYATADQEVVGDFVERNVKLITTARTRYLDDVEQAVTDTMERGELTTDLAEKIEPMLKAKGEKAQRQAKVIARDQVGKLNAQVNRHRQQKTGIGRFVWRTMLDNRVRDSHEELEGKEFSWKEGADGIFPGDEIMCRCYAEPVIDLDALEDDEDDDEEET